MRLGFWAFAIVYAEFFFLLALIAFTGIGLLAQRGCHVQVGSTSIVVGVGSVPDGGAQ